jgi:hypothetical protein
LATAVCKRMLVCVYRRTALIAPLMHRCLLLYDGAYEASDALVAVDSALQAVCTDTVLSRDVCLYSNSLTVVNGLPLLACVRTV